MECVARHCQFPLAGGDVHICCERRFPLPGERAGILDRRDSVRREAGVERFFRGGIAANALSDGLRFSFRLVVASWGRACDCFSGDAIWHDGAGFGWELRGVRDAVFAMIFALIGPPMLTAGPLNLWRACASKQWPVATGVVLSGKQSSGNVEAEAGARLVYRYEEAGRKRYSNVRVFGQTPDSSDSAGRFAYGKKVQVAYCPTDPDLAVLEPGVTNDAYYLPAAEGGISLVWPGGFFLWHSGVD